MDDSFATERAGAVTDARAGFWRRFAASFIDGILLVVISLILRALLHGIGSGLTLLIEIGYFTYFHGNTGQTPGDAALSIRVVDRSTGKPIGYGRAFLRWLVSLVSALILFIGFLWMLWDSEKQTWHDKVANDVVVPTGG